MAINTDVVDQEEMLDGFCAYATSLDDEAIDVLRIRLFHHEIEHIFRTTKSFFGDNALTYERALHIEDVTGIAEPVKKSHTVQMMWWLCSDTAVSLLQS